MSPAIPGTVRVAPSSREPAHDQDHVHAERHDRDDPGEAVVGDHDEDDQEKADDPGDPPLVDGVLPQRRPHGPLLHDAEGRRKGTGPEHEGQVAGLFHGGAAQLDLPPLTDLGADHRGAHHVVVEDDGDPLADVPAGDAAEVRPPARVSPNCTMGMLYCWSRVGADADSSWSPARKAVRSRT
jgi:hypothetical protein